MAKKYKAVDPLHTGTSKRLLVTDWSKCAFCQEGSSEVLHCPAESRQNTSGAGYKRISDLLVGFSTTGCLPRTMDLSHLDDGEGIEATVQQHKAKWHDSYRLQYNKTQLQRAEKRTSSTHRRRARCIYEVYTPKFGRGKYFRSNMLLLWQTCTTWKILEQSINIQN